MIIPILGGFLQYFIQANNVWFKVLALHILLQNALCNFSVT